MPWLSILLQLCWDKDLVLLAGLGVLTCSAIITLMVALRVCGYRMHEEREMRDEEKSKPSHQDPSHECVYVPASPSPTMLPASPFQPTPDLARRRRNLLSATRGGMRRWRGHRKHETLAYNPQLAHHCGYVCALKLAGKQVSVKAVKWP